MKIAYKNFTGGEISGSLSMRYDLGKFHNSCRYLENFIPDLHGPLHRRTGTYFLEDLGGPAMLIPFEFSSEPAQNYVLIMQNKKIRLAQKNGFVLQGETALPVEIASPYQETELYNISYAQSGDVVYLAHPAHRLHKIVRFGHTDWKIFQVGTLPEIKPPTGMSVKFSETGDYPLRYKVVAITSKGESSQAALGECANGKHPGDWVKGNYATISWNPVKEAENYNIYREKAGTFGLIGVSNAVDKSGKIVFRDDNYAPDTSDTPGEARDPFAEGNNPGIVCFHQQRLILGATAKEPQKWYGSRTGSYEDFSKSRPVKDDDSFDFLIASGRIDRIQWLISFGDLLIGTVGSEYKAIGADQGGITPASVMVREQSYWGSTAIRPLIIGNSVLHIQRQGSRVRDLSYSLERDGYAGNDLSVMASHLFRNRHIKQWEYQQSPNSTIWAIRDDGLMLAMVYMKEHDIWGWCRIITAGRYISVACNAGQLEDTLYCVVERIVKGEKKYFLERFLPEWDESRPVADAFYVDCGLSYENQTFPISTIGGLEHLEGCKVAILADGSPEPLQVVKDGKVELVHAAKVIHIGLPYSSVVSPQTPEAESPDGATTLGRVRNYGQCQLGLLGSVGGKYGPSRENLYEIPALPDYYDQPVQPCTEFINFIPDCSFTPESGIWFVQDQPLPFTITSIILDLDIEG